MGLFLSFLVPAIKPAESSGDKETERAVPLKMAYLKSGCKMD